MSQRPAPLGRGCPRDSVALSRWAGSSCPRPAAGAPTLPSRGGGGEQQLPGSAAGSDETRCKARGSGVSSPAPGGVGGRTSRASPRSWLWLWLWPLPRSAAPAPPAPLPGSPASALLSAGAGAPHEGASPRGSPGRAPAPAMSAPAAESTPPGFPPATAHPRVQPHPKAKHVHSRGRAPSRARGGGSPRGCFSKEKPGGVWGGGSGGAASWKCRGAAIARDAASPWAAKRSPAAVAAAAAGRRGGSGEGVNGRAPPVAAALRARARKRPHPRPARVTARGGRQAEKKEGAAADAPAPPPLPPPPPPPSLGLAAHESFPRAEPLREAGAAAASLASLPGTAAVAGAASLPPLLPEPGFDSGGEPSPPCATREPEPEPLPCAGPLPPCRRGAVDL